MSAATKAATNDNTHTGLVAALIAAQREFNPAIKGAVNPHFRSRYVDLQGAYDACKEALWNHGLTVIQYTQIDTCGPVLVTELVHVSGESKQGCYPLLPAKQNDPQALGAALTYARRYSLMAMVGMAPEDDDGNEASGRGEGSGPKAPPTRAPARSAQPSASPVASAESARPRVVTKQVQALQIAIRGLNLGGNTDDEKRIKRIEWHRAMAALYKAVQANTGVAEAFEAAIRAGVPRSTAAGIVRTFGSRE